jgi:hypothetical protein
MDRYLVDKFDGGIVDGYQSIAQGFNGKGYSYQLENLFLDENGKPFTRYGTFIHDTRISASAGTQRISGIVLGSAPLNYGIFFQYNRAMQMNVDGTFTEILGPASNNAVPNKTNSDLESSVVWRKQVIYASGPSTVLPGILYCSDDSPLTWNALTLGLPALASTPTLASAGGTLSNYIYAFHYYYEYTDYEGTVWSESGPVVTEDITNVGAPNANNITVSAIPVLANTASTNYIVSTTLKTKIFRTISNGTTLFFLADVNNGTTSYVDSTSDATIQERATIYTAGDLLDYNQPPIGSRYVTQVNGFFWYATDKLVTQSIQNSPGACPDEFYWYTDQTIRGLASTLSYPILFCDTSVYRIDGTFDELGDGGFDLREISNNAGCISNKSIVRVPGGLVWAGNGGFYYTDGDQVQKISLGLEKRYQNWKNSSIAGVYESTTNTVTWIVSSPGNPGTAPNDMFLRLYLNWGISPYSVFTTWGSPNNISPSALAYAESLDVSATFRSKLIIGENRGYLLYQDPSSYTDPAINQDFYPSEFKKKAIIYRYESLGMDLGADATRKYCTHITGEIWTETDTAAQFLTRRDDGGAWQSFSEMRTDEIITWDISEYAWDDTADPQWNAGYLTEGMRQFPSGALRSTRRQIGLTNSQTYISNSDTIGTAATDSSTKTVTLDTSTEFWPEDCEDYEIAFDSDSYATFYIIKERVSDTVIKVYDPYATLTTVAARDWEMRGYRKHERMRLLSYAVYFDQEGETQAPSRGNAEYRNA